ncbi:YciI family protein [Leptothrix discophora]|uniref:Transcription initiation protein n=1 Tax=Leptothrix discophora TaxID=89 RepID=A0ABT9G4Y5_LEPDI|nr:transcription initiation protein [Leptothrix discophora]MDP4301524.1 transcription initiation protein [Leptothrix discophora]
MAKYLISFPSAAMVVSGAELAAAGQDAHAVIEAAKAAGVYVFGGGIDEGVPPVRVSASGAAVEGGYPWAPPITGGFTVLEVPTREEALSWAVRMAAACRCDQELRVFGSDAQSVTTEEPRDESRP